MTKEQYQLDYDEFLREYKDGVTDGEKVGATISRMAQHFVDANLKNAMAMVAFNAAAKEIEESIDDDGKKISSAKAKVIAAATPASDQYILSKTHIENLEQIINALKSLQKGILNEYSHSSNM